MVSSNVSICTERRITFCLVQFFVTRSGYGSMNKGKIVIVFSRGRSYGRCTHIMFLGWLGKTLQDNVVIGLGLFASSPRSILAASVMRV